MANTSPATLPLGTLTTKCVAAKGLTLTVPPPVMLLLTESVAAMVWLPDVLSVTLNMPTPLVRVLLSGKPAAPSLLLMWIVPP